MGVGVGYADDTDWRGARGLGDGRSSKDENKTIERLREQPRWGREESIDKSRRFEGRGRGFELVNDEHYCSCRDRGVLWDIHISSARTSTTCVQKKPVAVQNTK